MKSVTSEIINHMSYKPVEITVYTKDAYIEDNTFYIISMTKVTVTSHPDLVETSQRALLIPTQITQHGISKKAKFHVLSNTNTDIDTVLSSGDLSDSDIAKVKLLTQNKVIKSSIKFENIIEGKNN